MQADRSLGFLAKIQYSIDSVFSSMHIGARDIIVYVTCFGLAFLAGVAFKRYGKWIMAGLISAIMIIALLHYFDFITVHHFKLVNLVGLQDVHTIDDFMTVLLAKVKIFWIEMILIAIALIVGFKLG
jgi:membrane-associated HD superfamily phosphohydrolase